MKTSIKSFIALTLSLSLLAGCSTATYTPPPTAPSPSITLPPAPAAPAKVAKVASPRAMVSAAPSAAVTVQGQVQTIPPPSVELGWDASPDPRVTGYFIYQGPAIGGWTNKMDVGNVTTCTVSNLVFGSTNFFTCTAYDAVGDESGFSNNVSYVAPAAPTPLPTPTNFHVIGSFAQDANGPWLPIEGWPALTFTNPVGTAIFRLSITRAP